MKSFPNEIWVLIDQDDWPASHVESSKEGKGIRQAVEARHQSHVLNEARHASDGKAPHEVRKVERGSERQAPFFLSCHCFAFV